MHSPFCFLRKKPLSIEKKKATEKAEEAEALAISQSMLKCEEEEEPMDKLNGIPPTQLSPRLGIHSNVIVGYVFYQTNFIIVNDLTELPKKLIFTRNGVKVSSSQLKFILFCC